MVNIPVYKKTLHTNRMNSRQNVARFYKKTQKNKISLPSLDSAKVLESVYRENA